MITMNPDEVRASLDELRREERESICVGYYAGRESTFVSTSAPEASPGMTVEIGCIAKPLTATLVARAVGEGLLSLSDAVGKHLPGLATPEFEELKIFHLLAHTHGIDYESLRVPPRDTRGFIDAHRLVNSALASGRLFRCGSLFSYGSVGYWISAAVLEAIYEVPFRTLLHIKLFDPFGVRPTFVGDCGTCPSMGGDLRLSAVDLLKLTRIHLPAEAESWCDVLTELRRDDLAMPPCGWHPTIRRFCLGWDDFGSGVFGHNSNGATDSAVVRFSPEAAQAIVVTAKNARTAVNALRLIRGSELQGSAPPRLPRLLSAAECLSVDLRRFVGRYEAADLCVNVGVAEGVLRADVFRKSDQTEESEPWIERALIAAEGDNFFPRPPETDLLSLVHFSHPSAEGKCQYLHARNCVYMRRE